MSPAVIIQQAAADGVSLALSSLGTIKAAGDQAAVARWFSVIRDDKPGIVAALRQAANDDTPPDPAAEARRQRVLAMLAERPGIRYAVVVDDPDTDPVTVALGIRGAMQDGSTVTCELRIPREKWDGVLFLEMLERHTIH